MKKIATTIKELIIADISSGKLPSGETLNELSLAKRFNVSRTPVREAIAILIAQNILVHKKGTGICVAHYTKEELAQMFEAMQEIEVICAQLAGKRLTLLSRAEIIEAQAKCITTADKNGRDEFLKANEEFHQAIYQATKNYFMIEVASNFRHRTHPFRSKSYQTKEDLINAAEAHESIIKSILNTDDQESTSHFRERISTYYMKVLSKN